ncbi:DUF2029 domain-containing protein, partial [Fulvivirga sp. RKSG066]|uniref:polyprenol phosphomannose-dependent alpha 1,6 mannosyltransferase MptB n=1 Tax=Fulvivirga aurantia TaxID=2529383 RepID=UPI0012BCB20F
MGKEDRYLTYTVVALSAAVYIYIGYFIERYHSVSLISSYILLFFAYWWLLKRSTSLSLPGLIFLGVAFRCLLLFGLPTLSDDIFRFVWDGRLIVEGINPFSQLPSEYIAANQLPGTLTKELFFQLNSPDYFTIYPPFAQFVFWLSATLSPDSVLGSAVIIRSLIILAEIGTIYFLVKLADYYKIKKRNILWYVLNPLVILELTGNLHFEAFMIFFLVASIYLLLTQRVVMASLLFAMAISAKLIPLIILPLFLKRLYRPTLIKFYGFTGMFTLLAFLPLVSQELIDGMTASLSLYFQKFEFNASIYYLVREVGYYFQGYNIISTAGPYLASLTFLLVTAYSIMRKQDKLPLAVIIVLGIYFLLATTVHPWYICTLLAFSVLTKYNVIVVWSLLIFLTYVGYSESGFKEVLWLTAIEYCGLI